MIVKKKNSFLAFLIQEALSISLTTQGRNLNDLNEEPILYCRESEVKCDSLNECLLSKNDCGRCVNLPIYSSELNKCIPQPSPLGRKFCGEDPVGLSCQNWSAQVQNCVYECEMEHPGTENGEFLRCMAGSSGPCPKTICEEVCDCIGKAECREPCMGRCTKFKENVLHKPDDFPSHGHLQAYFEGYLFK